MPRILSSPLCNIPRLSVFLLKPQEHETGIHREALQEPPAPAHLRGGRMRGKMTTKSTSPAATGTSASESPFHWEEVRATEAPDLAQPPKEATQEGRAG